MSAMDVNNEPPGSTSDRANANWQTATKRKGQSPPNRAIEKRTKQPKISDCMPPLTTHNRFSELPELPTEKTNDPNDHNQTSDEADNVDKTEQVLPKPPPIVVHDVEHISDIRTILDKTAGDTYTLKTMKNNQVKIMLKSIDTYRNVLKALKEKNLQLHSYQYKADKPLRVVLRNLHHSTDTEEIKCELSDKGFSVLNVWNVKHRKTKVPLPIFFIELAPADNNRNIYSINLFLHTRVKFEAPNQRTDIPRCARCQSYNHTMKYCDRAPRCIKCAGSHLSRECTRKEKDENVKCANCQGNHPANYKGCEVYQQIFKKAFPNLRPTRRPNPSGIQSNKNPANEATRQSINTPNVPLGRSSNPPCEPQRSEGTRRKATYADIARQETQWNQQVIHNSNGSPMVDDISELKALLKQQAEQTNRLLDQISSMINLMSALMSQKSK